MKKRKERSKLEIEKQEKGERILDREERRSGKERGSQKRGRKKK